MQVVDLKKTQASPTENQSTFKIGDQIEFTLKIWNSSQFEMSNLDISIYEMTAIKLEENQVKIQIENLAIDERRPIATLNGRIFENPDDAGSIYGIRDYLCRIKITGIIDLPPVHFEDIELETINITNG